jgi:hypothetical protein
MSPRWTVDLMFELEERFEKIQEEQPVLEPNLVATPVFSEIGETSPAPDYAREVLDNLIKASEPLELNQTSPVQRHDWAGNNAAFTCLFCSTVFIFSAVLNPTRGDSTN